MGCRYQPTHHPPASTASSSSLQTHQIGHSHTPCAKCSPLQVDWNYYEYHPAPLAILPKEYLAEVDSVSILLDADWSSPRQFDFTHLFRRIPKATSVTVEINHLYRSDLGILADGTASEDIAISCTVAEIHMAQLYKLLHTSHTADFPDKNFDLKCNWCSFLAFHQFSPSDSVAFKVEGAILVGELAQRIDSVKDIDGTRVCPTYVAWGMIDEWDDDTDCFGFLEGMSYNMDDWGFEYRQLLLMAGLEYDELIEMSS
jgi:hypothetical protein